MIACNLGSCIYIHTMGDKSMDTISFSYAYIEVWGFQVKLAVFKYLNDNFSRSYVAPSSIFQWFFNSDKSTE